MNQLQKEILSAEILNRAREKPKLNYPEDYLDLTIQKTKSKEV